MKMYKTVKGFISSGKDEPKSVEFKYSSSIRIGGHGLNFVEIEDTLAIKATRFHSQNELVNNIKFSDDMWLFDTSNIVSESQSLNEHLLKLNELFMPKINYLVDLQNKGHSIVIYNSVYTNSDIASIEIDPNNLEIFCKLNIRFGIAFHYY